MATTASAYDIQPGEVRTLGQPLRGYRIETITGKGKIGDYGTTGLTPVAHHDPRYRHSAGSLSDIFRMMDYMRNTPAITHDHDCTFCGHRIVRSLKELASFVAVVAGSHAAADSFLNHEHRDHRKSFFAIVECEVPAGGTIAYRNLEDQEITGTIRADRLQLGKKIILPRYYGKRDQSPVASLIEDLYGVEIHQPDTDDISLIASILEGKEIK